MCIHEFRMCIHKIPGCVIQNCHSSWISGIGGFSSFRSWNSLQPSHGFSSPGGNFCLERSQALLPTSPSSMRIIRCRQGKCPDEFLERGRGKIRKTWNSCLLWVLQGHGRAFPEGSSHPSIPVFPSGGEAGAAEAAGASPHPGEGEHRGAQRQGEPRREFPVGILLLSLSGMSWMGLGSSGRDAGAPWAWWESGKGRWEKGMGHQEEQISLGIKHREKQISRDI